MYCLHRYIYFHILNLKNCNHAKAPFCFRVAEFPLLSRFHIIFEAQLMKTSMTHSHSKYYSPTIIRETQHVNILTRNWGWTGQVPLILRGLIMIFLRTLNISTYWIYTSRKLVLMLTCIRILRCWSRCLIKHQLNCEHMFFVVNHHSTVMDILYFFLQQFLFENLAKIKSQNARMNLGNVWEDKMCQCCDFMHST